MRRPLPVIPVLALLGLLGSIWGIAQGAPRLGEGGPGFLAKEISGVLGWLLVGGASAGFLWLSLRRRRSG